MNRYGTNRYEANVANTVSRVAAWLRGLTRRYRKPLFVMVAATATLAVGVSAGQAPKAFSAPVEIAAR